MGNIVLLDELTINQIAAGEVIERPANVVKELVENSIDSGATNIVVEIKKGGKTYIQVTDNGKGMEQDDIDICMERHTTSKIRNIEDLNNTYTMGFRGEALASIASISKLTIQSKTNNNINGVKLVLEAGNIIKMEECAMPNGTQILVENLFYNTPVRYKFLKQDMTETRYIKEWIQKTAIANLNINFKLINDKKTIFSSNGNGSLEDIVYLLYGKEISENIIKVDYQYEDMRVTGVIGNTLISKDTRKDQIIFLNKRNIKNSIITNSIDQAFKGATGIGKFGFCILNLDIPAKYYDINVPPTKKEVRFNEEDKIYKLVYHSIKESMLNAEFLGSKENNNKDEKEEYVQNEYEFLKNSIPLKTSQEFVEKENKRKIEYKYIGIAFKTYIIVEIEGNIYLIDQHAAHERILYEQIKNNYKNNISQNIQMMLISEIVDLTNKELEFINENKKILINLGFDIEPFGENSIKINGIPDLEYRRKTNNIFLDILDEVISSERTHIKDVEERFIATVACKAAVKAGMDLSVEEVDYLIQTLFNLKNPYTFPHGRPTTIKYSVEEIKSKLK